MRDEQKRKIITLCRDGAGGGRIAVQGDISINIVKRKAFYTFTCPNCGKVFKAYGNSQRKFCCHACYIEYRFGGGHHG